MNNSSVSLQNSQSVQNTVPPTGGTYTVYAIANENGRVYVGATSNMPRQVRESLQEARVGTHRYFGAEPLAVAVYGENLSKRESEKRKAEVIEFFEGIDFEVANERTPNFGAYTTPKHAKSKDTRQVCRMNPDGSSFIYENSTVASQELNLRAENIRAVASGTLLSTGGHKFKFLSEVTRYSQAPQN